MSKRRRKSYDPDPGRRSRRGHHRGVEPAGLKRWRLAHRRTHDPVRRVKHSYSGPRGGRFWQGPRTRRYDPAPRFRRARAYIARHPRYRRIGGKVEGTLTRWGTILGALIGVGAGVYQGYNQYNTPANPNAWQNYLNQIIGGPIKNASGTVTRTAIPEISHLWRTSDPAGYTTFPWLKYKFTGINPDGTTSPSAWVYPFWISLGAWIASTFAMKIGRLGKLHRILRPINKLAKGATITTAIGALVLPGCGKYGPQGLPPPPPNNVVTMTQTQSSPLVQYTYLG